MSVIPAQPFQVELYDGEVHPPHGESTIELCALLYGGDTPAPFVFTSTSQRDHSMVRGIVTHEHKGGYVSIDVRVTDINVACTRLVVAAHVEELSPHNQHRTAAMAINPTLKRFTYSVRALGFGHTGAFMDEDSVCGAELFAITKNTEGGWTLDEHRPTTFPELVKIAWEHGGIMLNPWPA